MEKGMSLRDALPEREQVSFCRQILDAFDIAKQADIRTYSPLALAFLGDAVYSLVIRTAVVSRGNRQAEKLHRETSQLVCAKGQAAIGDAIREFLTGEEQAVYKRGRNANPYHRAKNATAEEYLKATALEALCGYLYLRGETERMLELIRLGREKAGL
ncbi:MAG: ribonuclease III domain-containing protein [Eubacteriales bacterium]|nr:ribonuclease III domain-containing protein [Eubacteriales bacterium]